MAITLALLTAALFGTGDFLGGLAGKRMSVLRVLAISHSIGLVLITVGAIVIADEFLLGDLAWGALAGTAGFIGLALLYRGLARGPMGVVAPLTAITSAAVPAGWGLLIDDESLAGTAWVGVVVALLAIGLASASPIERSSVSLAAILEALLAGVGFGLMFVGLDQTIEASAPWPNVGGRLMTVSAMAVFFFIGLIGGCAGSTACSVKIFRYQIMLAAMSTQLRRIQSPNSVHVPHFQDRPISQDVMDSVMVFFVMFFISLGALAFLLGLTGLDFITALSGAATAIGNIGPGLGPEIGPTGNFENLNSAAKGLLIFGMILGRLELMAVFVLFTRRFWQAA